MELKPRYTHISKINELLQEWFVEQCRSGCDVNESVVRKKALEINKDLNGDPKFNASKGWYSRWKKQFEHLDIQDKQFNIDEKEADRCIKILFVEPFYSGSHKQLIDTLISEYKDRSELVTLPGKKWPWRSRCAALTLSQIIPPRDSYEIIFCSSVVSLAELLGLRPDLQKLKKIVYFHENQLTYPKKETKQRDVQYGYNQITTCLSADHVIFNSKFNMTSFLYNIDNFLTILPDCRPKQLMNLIKPKSSYIYGPLEFSRIPVERGGRRYEGPLHIVWPHRWEYDKNPEEFFSILIQLKSENITFKVSVLGESFSQVPPVFEEGKKVLENEIVRWGFADSKDDYYEALCSGHVVVSTAHHEFYGIAMIEAVHCGCYPLVPNRLVYPEIYDYKSLYEDNNELYTRLKHFCNNPNLVAIEYKQMSLNLNKFDVKTVIEEFKRIFI